LIFATISALPGRHWYLDTRRLHSGHRIRSSKMVVQILRLPRTDKPKQHLLIQVNQKKANSLDLKLVGTEHEHLYHGHIKESGIKSLQASNYGGDLSEWKEILRYAFLHEHPSSGTAETLEGLETVAAISGTTLTITLRKNIGGITQRLGSVKLDQDDEREEISAFEWVDTAVSGADDLRYRLETLQASVSGQQTEVAKLNQQLDDLVKAKKEHEEEMLKKFAALLNAKKLKIRDQQRLLNGAKIDPEVAEATRSARDGGSGKGRAPKRSGRGKRKVDEVESDGDDDEVMPDDVKSEAVEDDDAERREEETPQQSEAEATEDEDDLDAPAALRSGKGKGKAVMRTMDVDDELPPERELPHRKKGEQAPAPIEEEDETDDEL